MTEELLALLGQHGIEVVVDVRSAPYSRYVPHFNRAALENSVRLTGMEYRYAGDYLGGRPEDPRLYRQEEGKDKQRPDYKAMAETERYQRGIKRLTKIAREKRTVLLCSEENPANCHRQHLISQTLLAMDIEVLHIRGDGQLEVAWVEENEPETPQQLSLGL